MLLPSLIVINTDVSTSIEVGWMAWSIGIGVEYN